MLRDKYFVINACGDKFYRALAHLSAERFIYVYLFVHCLVSRISYLVSRILNSSIIPLFNYSMCVP